MKKTIEYYMNLPYRLEIVPDTEEGGYGARYPELPGCITCAETLESIIKNAEDAKRVWIAAALEEGNEIPEPIDEAAHIDNAIASSEAEIQAGSELLDAKTAFGELNKKYLQ